MSEGRQIRASSNVSAPPVIAGLLCIWIIWSFAASDSPVLTISVGFVAFLAFKLLWRPGEPPTLLLLIAIHLLQISTSLLHANVLGVNVNRMSYYGVDLENATWVALGAVLCLAVGMRAGIAGPSIRSPAQARAEARAWSPKVAFLFFLATFLVDLLFKELSTLSEGLRQLFLAGAGVQWIGVFLLAYVCVSQKRGFAYLLVAIGIEVVVGFLGYFGQFRYVFFALFVAIASARPQLRMRSIVLLTLAAVAALLLAAFWSAIKPDYRKFVSEGVRAQVVLRPVGERLSYLVHAWKRWKRTIGKRVRHAPATHSICRIFRGDLTKRASE